MLITAKKLKHHLDDTKVIEKALNLYPNYDVVITGMLILLVVKS